MTWAKQIKFLGLPDHCSFIVYYTMPLLSMYLWELSVITSVWRPDADLNESGMHDDMQYLLLNLKLFFYSKAGVLCGIVSRKMWGMMEWLDMIKISAYVLVLSWNEQAQNIRKIWEWTPNKAPESFTNQNMFLELLPYSPHFPSLQNKVVSF